MGLNAFTDDPGRDLDAELLAFAQGRAGGRPARCLNPGCGRTYTIPASGAIICPHCSPDRDRIACQGGCGDTTENIDCLCESCAEALDLALWGPVNCEGDPT